MTKIPCIILAYYDFESIKTTIECLQEQEDRISIYVIENPSEHTNATIKPYLLNALKEGKIAKYLLFDKNITSNTIPMVLEAFWHEIERSEYIILTDGDVEVHGREWLSEQLNILDTCSDVFACVVALDPSNLPVQTFPNAGDWIAPITAEHELYDETETGIHLLLMRVGELRGFLHTISKQGISWVDVHLRHYRFQVAHKKWAATKHSRARHLAWDRYADLEHPYTRLKFAKTFEQH